MKTMGDSSSDDSDNMPLPTKRPNKKKRAADEESSDPCEAAWGKSEMANAEESEDESSDESSEESSEESDSDDSDDDELILDKKGTVKKGGKAAPTKKASTKGKKKKKTKGKDKKAVKAKKVYDLPGQKKDTPEELCGKRIFYETLYKQKPNCEMAALYLMEYGLLPKKEAEKLHAKVLKAKAAGKTIKHKAGKSKRSKDKRKGKGKKKKKGKTRKRKPLPTDSDDDDDEWSAMKRSGNGKRKLGPSKRAKKVQKAASGGVKRKRTNVDDALRPSKKHKKKVLDATSSESDDDDAPLLVAKSG